MVPDILQRVAGAPLVCSSCSKSAVKAPIILKEYGEVSIYVTLVETHFLMRFFAKNHADVSFVLRTGAKNIAAAWSKARRFNVFQYWLVLPLGCSS